MSGKVTDIRASPLHLCGEDVTAPALEFAGRMKHDGDSDGREQRLLEDTRSNGSCPGSSGLSRDRFPSLPPRPHCLWAAVSPLSSWLREAALRLGEAFLGLPTLWGYPGPPIFQPRCSLLCLRPRARQGQAPSSPCHDYQ